MRAVLAAISALRAFGRIHNINRGRLESDVQARTKEAATHSSAGNSPDCDLPFSHMG